MAIGYYDDARYRATNTQDLPNTGSLAGTAASAADVVRRRFMVATRVVDAVGHYIAGGTDAAVLKLTLNKSAAGTGTLTAIGTMVIGTQATFTNKDIDVTETSFDAGDELVIQRVAGTSAIVANVQVSINTRENFS